MRTPWSLSRWSTKRRWCLCSSGFALGRSRSSRPRWTWSMNLKCLRYIPSAYVEIRIGQRHGNGRLGNIFRFHWDLVKGQGQSWKRLWHLAMLMRNPGCGEWIAVWDGGFVQCPVITTRSPFLWSLFRDHMEW